MIKRYSPVLLSGIAVLYTLWYMHFDKPWTNAGAMSTIGLKHKTLFVIWGIITFTALSVNIVLSYQKHLKTKLYIPLLIISGIGMGLTLAFEFDYSKMPDYYFHSGGSLVFSVVTGTAIFLLFLLCYKKNSVFKAFTYLSAIILLGDLVFLIIFKETGLIETVPIFAGYVMLGITNTRRDKFETARKA